MDFFAHQAQAKKHTSVLVAYFGFAIVCIIASVYLASAMTLHATQTQAPAAGVWTDFVLWDPILFLYVVIGTLGVVFAGSLYKTVALSKGGSAVAEALGGRLLQADPVDVDERKLRNVVEEMAIAASVPMPKIYVLDNDTGINAFAAGHTPQDAAIGITRGGMRLLDRDELQGVIGHEFSHLLNGDMRINIRIMGALFGIVCLAVIGRLLLYSRGGGGRSRGPMMLIGLALIVIGALGIFFGRLIQAALSRQRELLADASAVQFTRNPAGLSRALQKIGRVGSKIESAHAAEASHMFFENGMGKTFIGWMATHPPLEQRIRAIDPTWNGTFGEITQRNFGMKTNREPI